MSYITKLEIGSQQQQERAVQKKLVFNELENKKANKHPFNAKTFIQHLNYFTRLSVINQIYKTFN